FDDDGHGSHRLDDSADLRRGRDVAVRADLRAAADKRVRIDHRPVAHPGTHVDIHRRHAGDALTEVAAVADAGTSGHDTHAALERDALYGPGGFIDKRLTRGIDRHV